MSKTIRVTAPYVTLKVTDAVNGTVLVGYYEGAIVDNVDDASAEHHIDAGMAVKAGKDDDPAGPPIIPAELQGDYSKNVASLTSTLTGEDEAPAADKGRPSAKARGTSNK